LKPALRDAPLMLDERRHPRRSAVASLKRREGRHEDLELRVIHGDQPWPH